MSYYNQSGERVQPPGKEALAIVFSVKHFHQYLYRKHFILKINHKPLTTIFGPKSSIPLITGSRLQHWATFPSGYDYEFHCVRPKNNCNVDGLTRPPLPFNNVELNVEEYELLYELS